MAAIFFLVCSTITIYLSSIQVKAQFTVLCGISKMHMVSCNLQMSPNSQFHISKLQFIFLIRVGGG